MSTARIIGIILLIGGIVLCVVGIIQVVDGTKSYISHSNRSTNIWGDVSMDFSLNKRNREDVGQIILGVLFSVGGLICFKIGLRKNLEEDKKQKASNNKEDTQG